MNVETFERKDFTDINVVRDEVSKIAMKNLSPDNNFDIMLKSDPREELTILDR